MILLLLSLVASAQTLDVGLAGEVVVEGQLAVRSSRSALVAQIRDQGWELKRRDGDDMVFTPPKPWMGKARLHPDGTLDFSRPVAVPKEADLAEMTGYGDFGATDRDAPLVGLVSEDAVAAGTSSQSAGHPYPVITPRLGLYILPRRSLLDSVHAELLDAVAPQRDRYRAAQMAHTNQHLLDTLPDRLDALWSAGTPLLSDAPLSGQQARKEEALRYWASLPDTSAGRALAASLEAWLNGVVQSSAVPVRPEEADMAYTARGDTWRFTLLFPDTPESP